MRAVLVIALCDLKRLFQDRSGVFWTLVLPLFFAAFFGLVFAGGNDPTTAQASLTVIDEDGGPLARRLVASLESERLELSEIAPAERADAEKVRTLVIPAGFSERVLAGETVVLRLEKEPGTNHEAALAAQARILAGVTRILADLVRASNAIGTVAGDDPAPLGAAALDALERTPDRVRVESRWAGDAQRVPSGFRQSLPGNAVMFVMLVALTYGAGSLTADRTSGTLRRLATAPLTRGEIVAGKIVGRLAIAAVQITFFVLAALVAQALLGVDVGEDPVGLWLMLLVWALAVAPLGVLYGAFFRDPDQAANMGVLTTLVLAGLGGCWWPLEVTPRALQQLALFLPTGWAMKGLHQIVAFGHGLGAAALPIAVLVVFAAVFTVLAARFLRVS